MGKLPKPASKYLRPEDGDTIEITAHPQTIPAEETRYGKERHVIPIQLLDGTEKQWGLNQASYRTLNIKPEAFNQLSGEEQAKLLRKISMQR